MKKFIWFVMLLVLAGSVAAQNDSPLKLAFAGHTMDGTKVDIEKLRGKVVVLNLWFINCPNCVGEIKELNKLVDEYKDNKDVVFLSLAASKKIDLAKFLIKNPFKYQIIPDATVLILTKFGTPDKNGDINVPFPLHYVIDREGNIVAKEQGIKGIKTVRTELIKQFSQTLVMTN